MKFIIDLVEPLIIECPFIKGKTHPPKVGSHFCTRECFNFVIKHETGKCHVYEFICSCGEDKPNLNNPPDNPVTILF